jgi:hypothetical protein
LTPLKNASSAAPCEQCSGPLQHNATNEVSGPFHSCAKYLMTLIA